MANRIEFDKGYKLTYDSNGKLLKREKWSYNPKKTTTTKSPTTTQKPFINENTTSDRHSMVAEKNKGKSYVAGQGFVDKKTTTPSYTSAFNRPDYINGKPAKQEQQKKTYDATKSNANKPKIEKKTYTVTEKDYQKAQDTSINRYVGAYNYERRKDPNSKKTQTAKKELENASANMQFTASKNISDNFKKMSDEARERSRDANLSLDERLDWEAKANAYKQESVKLNRQSQYDENIKKTDFDYNNTKDAEKYIEAGRAADTYLPKTNEEKESVVVKSTLGSLNQDDFLKAASLAMTGDEERKYYWNRGKNGEEAAFNYLKALYDTKGLGDRFAERFSSGIDKAVEQNKMSDFMRGSIGAGVAALEGITSTGESFYGIAQSVVEANNQEMSYNEMLSERLATKIINKEQQKTGNIGIDIARSVGQMLPAIAVSISTMGAGAPAFVSSIAASGTTFGTVYGKTYVDTRRQGYDAQDAAAYSTLNAGLEAGLQYALTGVSQLGGGVVTKGLSKKAGEIVNKFIKNPIARKGLNIFTMQGISSAGEFSEEYLQGFFDPLVRNAVLNENNEIDFFSEENFYQGGIGALTAFLFNIPTNISSASTQIDKAREIGENLSSEELIAHITTAKNYAKGTDAFKNAEFFETQYTEEEIANGEVNPIEAGYLVLDNIVEANRNDNIQDFIDGNTNWNDLSDAERRFIVDPKNADYMRETFDVDVDSNMSAETISKAVKNIAAQNSNNNIVAKEPSAVDLFEEMLDEDISTLTEEYGVKKEGLKKGVVLPKKTSETKTLSNMAASLLSNPDLSQEARAKLKQGVVKEDFSYVPITNKSLEAKVQEIFEQKDNDIDRVRKEEWQSVVDGNTPLTPVKSTLAITLYNEYVNAGNFQAAYEIALELRSFTTEYGQVIQTVSMLNKTTPDGALYSVERALARMNKKWQKKYKNFEKATISKDLAQKMLEAKNEEEISAARNEIIADIASQIPSNWFEKINAWRRISMLLNPITHARNIAGNAVSIPARALKDLIGVAIENKAEKKGYIKKEERTKSVLNPFSKADKKYLDAGIESYSKIKDILTENNKSDEVAVQRQKKVFNLKFLEFLRKLNFKALAAEDMWFSRYAYTRAYAKAMKARGISPDTLSKSDNVKLSEYAMEQALKATYREANALATSLEKFKRLNKATYVIGEGMMPFVKNPLNILKQGAEFSPIGVIKGIVDMTKGVKNETYTPAQAIDNLATGLSGTAIMALGAFLASQGLLTGGDDEENQNYALVIGDKSYTLDWAMPVALPLFMGVEAFNAFDTGDVTTSFTNMLDSITKISEPLFNFTVLSNINKSIKNTSNSESPMIDFVINLMTSYAGQFVPSIFGAISRVADDTKRTSYYEPNSEIPYEINALLQGVQKKVAGVTMQPKLDRWGNEVKSGNVGQRIVENMLSPGYYSEKPNSDIDKEIDELFLQTGEESVIPPVASKKVKINGVEHVLSADEYTKYSKTLGQTAYNSVSDVINSIDYKYMTPRERTIAIDTAYAYAEEKAKSEMFSDYKMSKAFSAISNGDFNIEEYAYYKSATNNINDNNKKNILYGLYLSENAKKGIYEAEFENKNTKKEKSIDYAVNKGIGVDSFIKTSSAMKTLSGEKQYERTRWIKNNAKDDNEMYLLYQTFIEDNKNYRNSIEYANDQGISAKTYLQREIEIAEMSNDKTTYADKDVVYENGELVEFDTVEYNSQNTKVNHAETLLNGGYTEDEILFFWQKEYPDDDGFSYIASIGLQPSAYVGYKTQVFKADVDENGKSITGTKKEKIMSYINSMNISEPQKLVLKMSVTDYTYSTPEYQRVIDYIVSRPISTKEKIKIFDNLGLKVVGNTVYPQKK